MNIEHFHHLIVAAECGNLTKAAKQLSITQSALTQSINALENNFGADLFVRGARGIHLTPFGTNLLPRAMLIVNEQERLLSDAAALKELESTHITVGVAPHVSNHVFQHAIDCLTQSEPHLTVHVILAETLDLADMLRKGVIEFAFCGKVSAGAALDELKFEQITERRHCLMARTAHPLFTHSDLVENKLLNYRWIAYDTAQIQTDLINLYPALQQALPKRLITTNSLSMMRALTLSTNTVAFLPVDYMSAELESGRVCILDIPNNDFLVTSGFLSHLDFPLSENLVKLREIVEKMCSSAEEGRKLNI